MRISVIAFGSLGDLVPYLLLGQGLHRAGHHVRFVAHETFRETVSRYPLEFFPQPANPPQAVLKDIRGRQATRFRKYLDILNRRWQPTPAEIQNLEEACSGVDAVVFSSTSWVPFHIAEGLGVPSVGAYIHPSWPTSSLPNPVGFVSFRLGGVLNLLSHLSVEQIFWRKNREWVNNLRKERYGLRTLNWKGMRGAIKDRGVPIVVGCSRHLVDRPHDWPANIQMTGFWIDHELHGWQPSRDLENFVSCGEKPLAIGFGSVFDPHANELLGMLLTALERTGQRAVLVSGWSEYQHQLPDNVYLAPYVPYSWLYPRVSAAIHACGAGTMAHAVTAGIPSIPIPFAGEQKFYAALLRRMGIATVPIRRKRATEALLTNAIFDVLRNERYRSNAKRIGERVNTEDGVGMAVEAIDRYLRDTVPIRHPRPEIEIARSLSIAE